MFEHQKRWFSNLEDAFVGLRQTLVEMVHDSLQHKPEGVADEEYFRELEPLLNHLASDCLRSQADPNSFVREWVKTKDNQEAMARVSPFGLLAMQTWQKARETDEKQQNVHGLKGVSALQHLGKVLRALRHEGITSASAAFLYFNPEEDWTIPVPRLKLQLRSLQVLKEDEIRELLCFLDSSGIGHVSYRPFRMAVADFLSVSRDFHSALSPEEFNAILCRVQARLLRSGLNFTQAMREADGKNSLPGPQFMQSLRSLRLGLSNKEVAQIFNSLSAESFRTAGTLHLPNPVQKGQVSMVLFEALLEKSSDNRLQDWAGLAFQRFRETLGDDRVQSTLRHHCEPPLRLYLAFTGFAALLTEIEPSITSAEIGRLWCVLEKEDFSDEPLVRFEELLSWMKCRRV